MRVYKRLCIVTYKNESKSKVFEGKSVKDIELKALIWSTEELNFPVNRVDIKVVKQ